MMVMFYGVKKGRNPGVYDTWECCQKQIGGFKDAVFKKFKTKSEATSYVETGPTIIEKLKQRCLYCNLHIVGDNTEMLCSNECNVMIHDNCFFDRYSNLKGSKFNSSLFKCYNCIFGNKTEKEESKINVDLGVDPMTADGRQRIISNEEGNGNFLPVENCDKMIHKRKSEIDSVDLKKEFENVDIFNVNLKALNERDDTIDILKSEVNYLRNIFHLLLEKLRKEDLQVTKEEFIYRGSQNVSCQTDFRREVDELTVNDESNDGVIAERFSNDDYRTGSLYRFGKEKAMDNIRRYNRHEEDGHCDSEENMVVNKNELIVQMDKDERRTYDSYRKSTIIRNSAGYNKLYIGGLGEIINNENIFDKIYEVIGKKEKFTCNRLKSMSKNYISYCIEAEYKVIQRLFYYEKWNDDITIRPFKGILKDVLIDYVLLNESNCDMRIVNLKNDNTREVNLHIGNALNEGPDNENLCNMYNNRLIVNKDNLDVKVCRVLLQQNYEEKNIVGNLGSGKQDINKNEIMNCFTNDIWEDKNNEKVLVNNQEILEEDRGVFKNNNEKDMDCDISDTNDIDNLQNMIIRDNLDDVKFDYERVKFENTKDLTIMTYVSTVIDERNEDLNEKVVLGGLSVIENKIGKDCNDRTDWNGATHEINKKAVLGGLSVIENKIGKDCNDRTDLNGATHEINVIDGQSILDEIKGTRKMQEKRISELDCRIKSINNDTDMNKSEVFNDTKSKNKEVEVVRSSFGRALKPVKKDL